MRILKIALLLVLSLSAISAMVTSCDNSHTEYITETTPSQTLASVKWKTTLVKDANGQDVTNQNMQFVGNAQYNMDGTYTITNFDGSVRSIGDWSITADGKRRILVGKNLNGNGEIIFTRIVDIITLTPKSFVYTITINGQKLTVEHVPF
ncbi:DUF4822 domain-containing protein [Chryseobacterium sp. JUb7]|uniref:DUF4822 domain-containing protein n=1 Tax=Chryseobacterium sp. JUb7 TaxID=2940599 RepID=UPI00216A2660|nr:DUF4822 domain-containing protein [Chryseobacterium sp. JUb7]MCS3529753.1 hypothetical protein [Chryseobacterium sp. JUb7]